ncbi:MAG TPA: transketolase [Candidatus Andersenbacteria bacterium]|nr:transketolase [Candidatus Andersenbacteria bacterium]
MQRLTELDDLKRMANTVRQDIIKMLLAAGSGHSAGPLDLADIATALYFNVLNIDSKRPHRKDRDRLIVSCGHTAPVWYAVLARAGFFPVEELKTLRQLGTRLQGHMDRLTVPGVETTAASLGQGLSIACGVAWAGTLDRLAYQTYCVLSDGEHDEGSTWEAIMFAGHYRLGHLTVIVDRNNIQIDGPTERIMTKEPMVERYEAFGWHVIEIDGHNIEQVIDACSEARAIVEKPVAIIAHTIPGKGVDFMEFDYRWHGSPPGSVETELTPPKDQQGAVALKQLRTLGGRITNSDL